MADRRFDRNNGFISLADTIPDDVYIVGAVIVTLDEAGNYASTYIPETLDEIPAPEVREHQGPQIAEAFHLANLTTTITKE